MATAKTGSKPRPATPPSKKPTGKGSAQASTVKKSPAPKKDTSKLSSEANSLQGTSGKDKLQPKGNMPNLIEAFGGDDQIWMNGQGNSQVNAGKGDDIIGVDGPSGSKHNTRIDGGEGRDAVFAGSSFENRNYTVTDEKGQTVAKNGEGGDNILVNNVESVHARSRRSGTNGNDQITSDLNTGKSDIRVNETHNIFARGGDDQIKVRTGDNGSSDVGIWGGEGNNQIRFDGGAASDRVSYTSERNTRTPDTKGSDQVRLDGGDGWDEASISSTNYQVVGADGKVISRMGEGADKISIENFERLTIHNGQGENGFESFDLYR